MKLGEKGKHPFASLLGRRIAVSFVSGLIALNLLFLLPQLVPSSPLTVKMAQLAGAGGTASITGAGEAIGGSIPTALVEMYIVKFGVNDSLDTKFYLFWLRFFSMDYGYSYWQYPEPVMNLVARALPWTLVLVIPIMPIGFVLGNFIGSRAAFKRDKLSNLLYIVSMLTTRAPYYWFAIFLMLIFGVWLRWFPLYGAYSTRWIRPALRWEWFLDAAHHYALPFLSLLPLATGAWAVGMRATILHELESDYIHYSRQLGFRSSALRKSAKDNSILPNFTNIPMIFTWLISSTMLVEVVFAYPGLGTLIYQSAMNLDYPLFQATFVMFILITIVGNLVIELLYAVLDPRIASGYAGE